MMFDNKLNKNDVDKMRVCINSEYNEMATASKSIDDMIVRYTDNFDILDDPTAIDSFLELLVQSLGSDLVQLTPQSLVEDEGAGMIMRRDIDSIVVGVDEDVPPSGLIVPIYEGINDFMTVVDQTVVSKKNKIFDVPVFEFFLDPATKPKKIDEVDLLVKAFSARNCIFFKPLGTFERALERQSIHFYLDIDDVLTCSREYVILGFDLTRDEFKKIAQTGFRVCSIRYSPYLPISVRYTKSLSVDDDATTGLMFASRKTSKFNNWHLSDGIRCYTPQYWAHWLRIPVSSIHIEFLAYEIIANFDFPVVRESLFAPYIVDDYVHTDDIILPPGRYKARNLSVPIIIGKKITIYLGKLEIESIVSVGDSKLSITGWFNNTKYVVRTCGQYPVDPIYFHFNGDYFVSISNVVRNIYYSGDVYPVNCSIALCYSNMSVSLTKGIISISPTSLAYTYHRVGRMAYQHQVLTNCDSISEFDNEDYSLPLIEYDPPPLDHVVM